MAHGDTFKMIKLVGESSKNIEDAVQTALAKSSESVRGFSWAHITDLRINLDTDGSIQAWQATLEAGFKVDGD
ncbi:MAG TPA: dodecin family protein [Myxococcota bacterium]|nr:dodecin family protein [Myxococcota bacterium]